MEIYGYPNRCLCVAVSFKNVTAGVTACTFNGVAMHAMTPKTATIAAVLDGVCWFYLLESELPAAGTYTLTATVDGALGTCSITGICLYNVKQSAPEAEGNASNTTGTTITGNITTLTAGAIVLDAILSATSTSAGTPGTGQFLLADAADGGTTHRQSVSWIRKDTAGATSTTWTTATDGHVLASIAVAPFAASTLTVAALDVSKDTPAPRPFRARAVETVAPVGALIVAGLSSIGWGTSVALPSAAKQVNRPALQPVAPVGTGTFALTKFAHAGVAPLPAAPLRANAPALQPSQPVGTLIASPSPSLGWLQIDGSPPASRSLVITAVVGDEFVRLATSLSSVGWLTCDAPPRGSLVRAKAQEEAAPTSPLRPFVSASTGWFPAEYRTPPLLARRVEPSAPTGPLVPFVSPTLGWVTIESRAPLLPPPRAQEPAQPTGPLAPFVSLSTGWLTPPALSAALSRPSRAASSEPVGSPFATGGLSSLGWLGANEFRPAAPTLRDQSAQQPSGPLSPFVSLSIGWMGAVPLPFDAPLVPPRVSDSAPTGVLLSPQPFGWNAPHQERPAPVVAKRPEPSAPVGTPFAIALPSNGWLATENPRTPLALGRSTPTDPVGNLLVLPPLPNLSWLLIADNPRTPLKLGRSAPTDPVGSLLVAAPLPNLSWLLAADNPRTPYATHRAVPGDPVGTAFPFLARLGPFWFLDQGPRAPAAPPQQQAAAPVGALFSTLSSVGWFAQPEARRAQLSPTAPIPSEPLRALQFGGSPWADITSSPARVAAGRQQETSAPVGSPITVGLSSLGWLGPDAQRAAQSPARLLHPSQGFAPLAFGGAPWTSTELPRAPASTARVSPSAPLGTLIVTPPETSVGWMSAMDLPPRAQAFSPMAIEIASVSSYTATVIPLTGPFVSLGFLPVGFRITSGVFS